MTNPTTEQKLRVSDVAHAADTSAEAISIWIKRGMVQLASERGEGWRTFSIVDVVILSMVRRLTDYGMTVPDASDIASRVLRVLAGELLEYRNTPPKALSARFSGFFLATWQEKDGWEFIVVAGEGSGFEPLFGTSEELSDPDTFVWMNLGDVAKDCVDRATAALEAGKEMKPTSILLRRHVLRKLEALAHEHEKPVGDVIEGLVAFTEDGQYLPDEVSREAFVELLKSEIATAGDGGWTGGRSREEVLEDDFGEKQKAD